MLFEASFWSRQVSHGLMVHHLEQVTGFCFPSSGDGNLHPAMFPQRGERMDVTVPIIIACTFFSLYFMNVFSEQYVILCISCLGYLHLTWWDSYFYHLSMQVYDYRRHDDLYSSTICEGLICPLITIAIGLMFFFF